MTDTAVDFESFKSAWLEDVTRGNPHTVELGKRFAFKIVTQWLDEAELGPDLVYCDGSGDGGIDIAYLDRGEGSSQEPSEAVSDTWYSGSEQ